MGIFERYLSLWVAISILTGIVLGNLMPGAFQLITHWEYAHVNLLIALLIWLMIYPMMIQVDISSITKVGKKPKALLLTLIVNWAIKPFTMAALGWLFFHIIFSDWISVESANQYIAGMILLGVAPCTAMVFVWSQLTKGDPNYTLVQVSVNDIIMVFAFAPIAALLLGISNITVPWQTLLLSVVLYVVIPLIAGPSDTKTAAQPGHLFSQPIKTTVYSRIIGYCGTTVWLSGQDFTEPASDHRFDCYTTFNSKLWDLLYCLSDSKVYSVSPTIPPLRLP